MENTDLKHHGVFRLVGVESGCALGKSIAIIIFKNLSVSVG